MRPSDSEGFVLQLEIELLVTLTVRHHLDHLPPPPVFPLLLPGPLQQGLVLHVLDHLLQGGVARHQLAPPVPGSPEVMCGLTSPTQPAVTELTGVERGRLAGLTVLPARPPLHHLLQADHRLLLPLHHRPHRPLVHPRLLHKRLGRRMGLLVSLRCPGLVVRIDITSTSSTSSTWSLARPALQAHHRSGKSRNVSVFS